MDEFRSMQRTATAMTVIGALVSLATVGGILWVIVYAIDKLTK